MATKITKDTIVADVLKINRELASVFMQNGMHCIGCVAASGESIEDACKVHSIDAQKLVDQLNYFLESKENK
jgi:hybrid cluster-associated redox disulfide protein